MTYLFFVNGTYWDRTRDNSLAFAWMRDWSKLGHDSGLKFIKDGDKESLMWLVPKKLWKNVEAA